MCPALGSAPSPPQKAWPHRPLGPPYKLPIQGAGPRGRGGLALSVVAVSMALSLPLWFWLEGAPRVALCEWKKQAAIAIRIKTRAI